MKSDHSSFDTILFRIGLVSAGGLFIHLAYHLASSIRINNHLLNTVLMIVIGGLGLLMLVSAGMRRVTDWFRWLILIAFVSEVVLQALVWIQNSDLPGYIIADAGLYVDLAGELLQRGHNPYTWDYGGVFELYRTGKGVSTPLLNGAPESPFPYAALSFLLVIPFQLLGLPGVFSLSVASHIAVLVLVFIATPHRWQPVILLPTLVGLGYGWTDFTILTLVGSTDMLWVLVIIGMLVSWRHWKWRAILFGLAVSLKQSPALLAPFLLVRLWHEVPDRRFRHLAGFVCLSAASFLLINGPFILWNPSAWFQGYTEPLRDNQVFLSQGGLSTLTHLGIVYLPKSFFLMATLSVFGLLLFIYWRHYVELRDVFLVLPGILMWFSYRSLAQYWLFWAFPMILVTTSRQNMVLLSSRQPSWKPTLVAIFGTLATLVTLGAVLVSPHPPVQMSLQFPMFSTSGRIDRLTLSVSNHSGAVLTPRFSIQSVQTGMSPLPWTIEAGPPILQPGEIGEYRISSSLLDRTFYAHNTSQLVVTDAGGDYRLRGVLTIESDRTYLWPEAIPNPDFRLWDTSRMTPLFWTVLGKGKIEPSITSEYNAFRLVGLGGSSEPRRLALANTILFPSTAFGLWVVPPSTDATFAYGLEILSSNHHLWILFGPEDYTGPIDEGVSVLNRFAPAGMWSYQEVNLQAAFDEAGWELPPLRRSDVRGTYIDARQIELRLFFISQDPTINSATFGPIQQNDYRVPPTTLMAETLDDPAGYYMRLAESYLSERNTSYALEAFQRGLEFTPKDRETLARIEWLNQQLDKEGP